MLFSAITQRIMLFKLVFGLACLGVCWGYHHHHHHHGGDTDVGDELLVRTPAGSISGSWMATRKGRRFRGFRGIRYADPPTGEMRFQPPRPIYNYGAGVVNASVEGPACPTFADEYYYANFSEDCLRLNVYTPTRKYERSAPLPVVVFIHAGGFYSMSGRSDLAGPEYLLDRDLVLVTINYRLGSLGFLSTGDELVPGNNGFKDQVVALKWIQRNIRSFGGDPDLVTITGCSAGSYSVMLHMISPMSKGLFHRGISMSGSPTPKSVTPHDLRPLAVQQAALLNCTADSTLEMLTCLRGKTWREIGDSLLGFFTYGWDPLTLWMPVIEPDFGQERFLAIEPVDAIKQRKMHEVPYIITMTELEFTWKAFTILQNATLLALMNSNWTSTAPLSFSLPRENLPRALTVLRNEYLGDSPLANDEKSVRALGRLYGDSLIGFNVHRLANLMCRHSRRAVYYGKFTYVGEHSHYEDPHSGKPIGAMHHDDLIYLFGLTYRFPVITDLNSEDSKMVDRMTALWYNFAKYGDPNPRPLEDLPELSSLSWPRMRPSDRRYVNLDTHFTVGENMFEDRFRVWDDIYPIQY